MGRLLLLGRRVDLHPLFNTPYKLLVFSIKNVASVRRRSPSILLPLCQSVLLVDAAPQDSALDWAAAR